MDLNCERSASSRNSTTDKQKQKLNVVHKCGKVISTKQRIRHTVRMSHTARPKATAMTDACELGEMSQETCDVSLLYKTYACLPCLLTLLSF